MVAREKAPNSPSHARNVYSPCRIAIHSRRYRRSDARYGKVRLQFGQFNSVPPSEIFGLGGDANRSRVLDPPPSVSISVCVNSFLQCGQLTTQRGAIRRFLRMERGLETSNIRSARTDYQVKPAAHSPFHLHGRSRRRSLSLTTQVHRSPPLVLNRTAPCPRDVLA